jgi:hypothetical protein
VSAGGNKPPPIARVEDNVSFANIPAPLPPLPVPALAQTSASLTKSSLAEPSNNTSPPAKRTRKAAKRRGEVELLRGEDEGEELQLFPLSCAPPSPSRSLPSPQTAPKAAPFPFENQLILAPSSSLTPSISPSPWTPPSPAPRLHLRPCAITIRAAFAAKVPCAANTSADRHTRHFVAESPLSGMPS